MQPTFVHRARVLLVFLALLFCACASRKSYQPLDAPAVSVERVYEILASAKGSADPEEAEVDRWFGPRAMGAGMRPA